jgi:nucleotide-binding universal stress UspA family protein
MITKRLRLLIGYDGSPCADEAIGDLYRAGLPDDVDALVVTVEETPTLPSMVRHEVIEPAFVEWAATIATHPDVHWSQSLAKARDEANTARRYIKSCFPNWQIRSLAMSGMPAAELIKKAEEWSAQVIVVGSQGRSALGRLLLGSVSLQVAMQAQCSVRIGRANDETRPGSPGRIIVGVNGLKGSELPIRHVLKRTWPKGSELRVIAVNDSQVSNTITVPESMVTLAGTRGLKVDAESRRGDPAEELISVAHEWGADCIFVSAGFGTSSDDVKDVARQLAMQASCSIEIVK